MTRIVFYYNVADRHGFIQKLLYTKALYRGGARKDGDWQPSQTALIFGSDTTLRSLSDALWASERFFPHDFWNEGMRPADAPIALASAPPPPDYVCDILLSLSADAPTDLLGRFPVCVDVVGQEEESKRTGRTRLRYFLDHGYDVQKINMTPDAANRPVNRSQ